MTWFCYLLFSENTRRTYIGATVDILPFLHRMYIL